jgi:hypothetical protein
MESVHLEEEAERHREEVYVGVTALGSVVPRLQEASEAEDEELGAKSDAPAVARRRLASRTERALAAMCSGSASMPNEPALCLGLNVYMIQPNRTDRANHSRAMTLR